jgi:hypothetical protein
MNPLGIVVPPTITQMELLIMDYYKLTLYGGVQEALVLNMMVAMPLANPCLIVKPMLVALKLC